MSTRVIDLVARPAVLFSVLGLLLIGHAWQIRIQHQQFVRITAMEATIQNLQHQQSDQITTIEASIQKQAEILETALGNVLPVKMSPEWERHFEELETRVATPKQWPTNAAQAEDFMEKLSGLISDMSPLAESTYFPRISLVRWAAVAFERLHHVPVTDEPLDVVAEQLLAIADARPEGVVSDLEQRLRAIADDFVNQAEAQRVEEAIQQARTYLTSDETLGKDPLTSETSIDEVHEILGSYENDVRLGNEIRELRNKLQRHIAMREAQSQSAALKDQWVNAKKLAKTQPEVYETVASLLLREVSVAGAVLALQGIQQPIYSELETQLRTAVEATQEDNRLRYQKWTLEQIMKFEDKHDVIADKAAQDARLLAIDNAGWNDDRFREVQEAMEDFLLPIDRTLLDLPILKRYQREFDSGWNRLDGRKEQTNLAIASSLTRKQNISSLAVE